MSEPAEAARPVASNKSRPTGVTIGIADGKSPGVSIGVGGEKSAGVSIGLGGDKSAGVSIGVGGEKSAGMHIGAGAEKSLGGKSAGISIGIGGEKTSGGVSIGIGGEKSTGTSASKGDEKSAGVSKRVGQEKPSIGVSIPESVVAPLIGAGANVYIMTNELTQSMREKLGTSWPFVQDTLNSRYAKLLAGGLLASVAVIVVWKIIKRFSAKPKTPADSEDESCQWTSTKTFEMQRQILRAEGDHAGSYPLHMLPHKIQMRVTDTPLQTTRVAEPELCKARDGATRHRHTRHLDKRQREQEATECYSPWHSEQPHPSDLQCSCPTELRGSLTPQPRLLYCVKENRMMQRALSLSNMHQENLLTYASSPSALCPTVLESVCPHECCKPYCGASHGLSACTAHFSLMPSRLSDGASPLIPHQHVYHSPFTDVNLITTPSQPPVSVLVSSCPPLQRGSPHHSLPTAVSSGASYISVPHNESTGTILSWPDGTSIQESRPMSSLSGITEIAACQTLTTDTETSSQTVESRARSVSQQTDGHPVEEDLDMPGHVTDTQPRANLQPTQTQKVPTRMAQSPVTPSQCTNAPTRTDNTQMRLHTSATCPSHISSCGQSYQPTVYQTTQGAMVQLSPGGECPSLYHQHALHLQAQNPVLNGFSNTTQLQPVTYQQHVTVDQILPSSVQHQQMARVQPQHGQQQQQPVVQHPSDSSVSQNSSEVCTSQETKQYEGSQLTTSRQETTPLEVLPQERMLVQQYNASGASNSLSPPSLALAHHHTSSLPALTDYAQADYPWRGSRALHNYQPTPMSALGYQFPSSRYYSALHNPWSPQATMLLPPFVVSPAASLLLSPPAGMLASYSEGLLPSLQQDRLMASHWPNPYLYQQAPLPVARHATINPNFNLSNSNTHVFIQDSGQNSIQAAPFHQESSKVRVIESDHSINSHQTSATAVKTESTTVSSSEISVQTIGENAPEIPTKGVEETAGPAQGYMLEYSPSCDMPHTDLTAPVEEINVFQADAVGPRDASACQGEGAASEHSEVLQEDAQVKGHVEELSDPASSTNSSASSNGGETQL